MSASRTRDSGFTIVELLIVIVVIALLAAISIVAYNGIQDRARASAAMAAVSQASDALTLYGIEHGDSYPADLQEAGIAESGDTRYQYAVNNDTSPASFCVAAVVGTKSFHASSAQLTPAEGRCLGDGEGNVAPRLAYWKKEGSGIVYDSAADELILSKSGSGRYASTLLDVSGSSSITLAFEVRATSTSPYYTPDSGVYTGSSYFAADRATPAIGGSGHVGNGNAQRIPLNSWTTYTTSFPTGASVSYARIFINSSPAYYTSDARIRNVRITINR